MSINEEEQSFQALVEFLRQVRGFDFRGYKPSSLKRRVRKRMQYHDLEKFSDYLDYLQVHPEEFLPLFNTILINVTGFFRDASAWKYLENQVLSPLIREKSEQEQIRIWSAGCASGEEAYTLAVLLAEMLGTEQFRQRVKIYATDVDEETLVQARHASYSSQQIEPVPLELREKFFDVVGDRYIFHTDLRRGVIFGRHDLVQDAPISRLDLLVCRNTLMYFNAETQENILHRFHFAIKDTGFLFLGKAEMLLTHANIFTPVNLQHRIFRRVPGINRNRRLLLPQLFEPNLGQPLESCWQLRETAFDAIPIPQLIVDIEGTLVLANTQARSVFALNLLDLGRPLQDLEISYRPLELRSHIDRVYQERRLIIITDIERHLRNAKNQYLDVYFNPLEDNEGELLGVSISFIDVSRYQKLRLELQQSNQELETANEELQSSNEELETANEELQSTNEELETTNEELQSSNEELETTNEELQSTNEELKTINDELRIRTSELNEANAFLKSILASLQAGVIVVDDQFEILTWNEQSENLWGLRAEEVKGKSLLALDIGLPVEQLREPICNSLSDTADRQGMLLEAINRRGKTIQCRINYNPLIGTEQERWGVIILVEEIKDAKQ